MVLLLLLTSVSLSTFGKQMFSANPGLLVFDKLSSTVRTVIFANDKIEPCLFAKGGGWNYSQNQGKDNKNWGLRA